MHQVAVLAMRDKTLQLKIKGLLPVHPYFGSEKRTDKEKADIADIAAGNVASNDMFWRLSIPEGYSRDYYGCNVEMQEVSEAEWREFPPVVVYVAGRDFLKERGVMYAEFLRGKGAKRVEIVEAEAESHVFHVFHPVSEATKLLQQQMTEFMKSC